MILHTTISSIPSRVLLTYHAPLEGGLMDIPVPEHFEIEQIQDVHGRPSIWLMEKMTAADEERIIELAFDTLDGGRRFSHA
mgnify:CR=1 FL=1